MLKVIHRYKKTLLGVFAVAAVALTMTGFGLGSVLGNREQVAIKVNKETVSFQEFYSKKKELENSYTRFFGPRILENLNINQLTSDRIIASMLIKHLTDEMSLAASNRDIANAIVRTGLFPDGFDSQRYAAFLSQMGKTAAQFEAELRSDVIQQQFGDLLQDISFVSNREVTSALEIEDTKYDVDYLELDPKSLEKEVNIPSDAELEAFYNENATNYEIPKRIKYDYLVLDPKDFRDSVDITDEDVELYYAEHESNFRVGEEVKARHIQLSFPAKADQKKKDEIKATADKLVGRSTGGESFEALVKQYSDDFATKDIGGDLGWFGHGKLSKEVEEAAFKLKNGGISDPILTKYGYEIVKVDSYRAARTKELSEVKEQIVSAIVAERAPAFTSVKAQELFSVWQKTETPLSEFAVQQNMVASSVSNLMKEGEDPSVSLAGLTKKIISFPDEKKQLIELRDKTVLAEIREFRDSEILTFGEVRQKVIEAYKAKQSVKVAETKAKEILNSFAKGAYGILPAVGKALNLEIKDQKDFGRSSSSQAGPFMDAKVRNLVFSTTKELSLPTEYYSVGDKFYIIQVKAIKKPKPEDLKSKVESFRKQEAQKSGSMLYSSIVNALKAKAEIDISPQVL